MDIRSTPPALESYLRLAPETSLLVLTSTLSCSSSWLASRYIANILDSDSSTSIVLASWLHGLAFWNAELKRKTGTDISRLPQKRFRFHSFLSQIPAPSLQETEAILTETLLQLDESQQADEAQQPDPSSEEHRRKPILVLDHPSLLLATDPTSTSASASALNSVLLNVRSHAHSTVLLSPAFCSRPTLSAPTSLESAYEHIWQTPLEIETSSFLTAQAHAARLVMSVRELDTGAATDVSGVLRVTRGGAGYGSSYAAFDGIWEKEDGGSENVLREAELLYLVPRDGNVKVFSRGSNAS